MSIRRFSAADAGFTEAFGKFLSLRRAQGTEDVHTATSVIVRDVRRRGGEAVAAQTSRFDKLDLDPQTLQAKGVDLLEAAERCAPDVREALNFAAQRIERYHQEQRPKDHSFVDPNGLELGWRWSAVDAVGLYVPGGRASYPSSVLMNAIPARAAGVKRIVMVSPVPGGVFNPAVAYAAVRAGVTEFYPIGGAQAVAALAYGAGDLRPVDKIVGPGNAYVAAAKRIVFGDVGIDTIAGPSEITVVADNQNAPEWIAADLLSQAEHDPLAQSILITDDAEWASRVEAAVERQIVQLTTSKTAVDAWREYGAIVIAPFPQAAEIVNQIAPEHVEIATSDPDAIANDVRHSGAIFLGRYAPEALGDYVTGSNHVLPTSGAARFASGLSVLDFMKRTSVQRITERGFRHLATAAETLAKCEGLPAHGLSVSIRRGRGMTSNARIVSIEIDERSLAPAGPDAEHERKVAIFDLIESNSFKVIGHDGGPYALVLSLADNRLVFDISEQDGAPVRKLLLSLTALRRVIKDYFMICDSYYDAIRSSSPSQIEAIDMGRRGLHNEGSQVLTERLADKAEVDFDTARRLFTLVCALHARS